MFLDKKSGFLRGVGDPFRRRCRTPFRVEQQREKTRERDQNVTAVSLAINTQAHWAVCGCAALDRAMATE
jgi:hypothetical protein